MVKQLFQLLHGIFNCMVSRYDLSIDACCRNQPDKLVLYRPLIHFNSNLKQLHISNNTVQFSYKDECGICVCVHASNCLKQALVWAADKWFRLFVIHYLKQLYY